MRYLLTLASLLGACVAAAPDNTPKSLGHPSVARAGGIENIVISKYNTLNGTYHSAKTTVVPSWAFRGKSAQAGGLRLDLKNIIGTLDGPAFAYITGTDDQNRLIFVDGNGNVIYPSSGGSATPVPLNADAAIPLGEFDDVTSVTLPTAIKSGRVYFSTNKIQFFMVNHGGQDSLVQPDPTSLSDPNAATSWGFVEFTYGDGGSLYANVSYVDFVGLSAGMSLTVTDGTGTQLVKSINSGRNMGYEMAIAAYLDGFPWDQLTVVTNTSEHWIRTVSPNLRQDLFGDYFRTYIDDVWNHYSSTPLTIDGQGASGVGQVNCQVSGDRLNCDGGLSYAKPSTADIWGCNSGPFANEGSAQNKVLVPRICAAFNRLTLLLDGGNVQPSLDSSHYYGNFQGNRTHQYAKFVHFLETDGKGYAFSYDDVTPTGQPDVSGKVTSPHPGTWTVYCGGYYEQNE